MYDTPLSLQELRTFFKMKQYFKTRASPLAREYCLYVWDLLIEAGGQQCENLLLNKEKWNAQEKGGLHTAGNFRLYMSKCYHNNCCAHGHDKKYSLYIYIWLNSNAWGSAIYKHTHILTHKLRYHVHCYHVLAYSPSPSLPVTYQFNNVIFCSYL